MYSSVLLYIRASKSMSALVVMISINAKVAIMTREQEKDLQNSRMLAIGLREDDWVSYKA